MRHGGTIYLRIFRTAVCEIDIDLAEEVANEALNADLPCGFGRD